MAPKNFRVFLLPYELGVKNSVDFTVTLALLDEHIGGPSMVCLSHGENPQAHFNEVMGPTTPALSAEKDFKFQ